MHLPISFQRLPGIFADPSGRRRQATLRLLGLLVGACLLVAGGLSDGLLRGPVLPRRPEAGPPGRPLPAPLARPARAPRPSPRRPGQATVVAAYYAPSEDSALNSLRAHGPGLTHVLPRWFGLREDGLSADLTDYDLHENPHNQDLLNIAREHRLTVMPVLEAEPARASRLLRDEAAQVRVAEALGALTPCLQVDFRGLPPADAALVPGFLERLKLREVSVVLDEALLEQELGASLCFVKPDLLERACERLPAGRLILELPTYGRDGVEPISFFEALGRLGPHPEALCFDPATGRNSFRYECAGEHHEVWFPDAVSAASQWARAHSLGLQGAALEALGSEDPSVWTFFGRKAIRRPPDFRLLKRIDFPFALDFVGRGEILEVQAEPEAGHRHLEVREGQVVAQRYHHLPKPYRIRRSGYQPAMVALTFDDGPVPRYTEEILDVLRAEGVPATFFVLGSQAQRHPDLLRRLYAEGHEVGSHSFSHPNLGAVSEARVEFELNLTQRVFQSLLGRSSVLFRPPYHADADPTSAEEVRPMAVASRLGYVTVAESLDPEDWRLTESDGGVQRPRTAEDIVAESLLQIEGGHGNCLLLHDGGGDRSATVTALRALIPLLKSRGYRFVGVSALMGRTREDVMPPTQERPWLLLTHRLAFTLSSWGATLLELAFTGAIVLGVARLALILALALRSRRVTGPEFRPPVTVVIAAYNEARVIVRTVKSVLASDYPELRVFVVDDGSRDGTSDVLLSHFARDPRFALLAQPNAGKAAALNHALSLVSTEYIVAVDGDTILDPRAVGRLVRHLRDPRVGAVAGNVKVGNRCNLVTRWQSLEYIASQNLERRAYAVLDAMPVVPGAIGAWRVSALRRLGGYRSDTLAEDMDLTMRLHRAGYRVVEEMGALAWTEAPDTLAALFKQRLRWSYGTLQCLWKHAGALGSCGWLGALVLPSLWLFQILFQLLAPAVDLQMLVSLFGSWNCTSAAWWQPSWTLAFYVAFFALELGAAWLAVRLDGEDQRELVWLFTQRLVYRQLLYLVVLRSLGRAVAGLAGSWGKLERRGTVALGLLALLALPVRADDGFYEAWKVRYLRHGQEGAYVAIQPGQPKTVSEAHGYGMLLTVAHGERGEFDALLRFRHAHPSPCSRWLMEWKVPRPGPETSSATDGDLDAAYALLWAHRVWSDAAYLREARLILADVLRYECNPAARVPGLGDFISPEEPSGWWGVRSSDLMPGHFRAFYRATGDKRWQVALDGSYALLARVQSAPGLWPDFVLLRPVPRAAGPGYLEGPRDGCFDYNACRVPWRIGVDVDPRAVSLLRPFTRWAREVTGGQPRRFLDGYRLDGRPSGGDQVCSQAFLAPLAVAAGREGGPGRRPCGRLCGPPRSARRTTTATRSKRSACSSRPGSGSGCREPPTLPARTGRESWRSFGPSRRAARHAESLPWRSPVRPANGPSARGTSRGPAPAGPGPGPGRPSRPPGSPGKPWPARCRPLASAGPAAAAGVPSHASGRPGRGWRRSARRTASLRPGALQ